MTYLFPHTVFSLEIMKLLPSLITVGLSGSVLASIMALLKSESFVTTCAAAYTFAGNKPAKLVNANTTASIAMLIAFNTFFR